MRDDKFELK